MRRRRRTKRTAAYRWLQTGALILLAGVAGFFLVKIEHRPLGAEELKIQATELRSEAAQGKLIAEAAASGKITSAYLREQLSLLGEKTEQKQTKLDKAKPAEGLEAALARLSALANRLRADLALLAAAREQGADITRIGDDLANIVQQLAQLEDGLTRS